MKLKRHKYDPSLYLYDLVVKILKQQQFLLLFNLSALAMITHT